MRVDDRFRRLVLVEDDLDDATAVGRTLAKSHPNLQVAIAPGGAEALFNLTRDPFVPDLILTDVRMHLLDGCDLVRELRGLEAFREVPIIVFSSMENPSEIERCMEAGCSEFVRKPYDYSEYQEALRGIVDRWLDVKHRAAK